MSEFSLLLEESKTIQRKVLRQQKIHHLRALLLPLVAHAASVVTLFALYFTRSGSFTFEKDQWGDWAILLLVVGIIASGGIVLSLEVRRRVQMVLNRKQLTQMLLLARNHAETTADTIGGDLSWIFDEKGALAALKKARPELIIRVFFDKARASSEALAAAEDLKLAGISMIAYTFAPPAIRCLILDAESDNARRVFVYPRGSSEQVGQEQTFKWLELEPKDTVAVTMVSYFKHIKRARVRPTVIGISGVNNVGKTTLANKLLERLRATTDRSVELVPDQFREVARPTTVDGNVRILFHQVLSQAKGDPALRLLDRTLADNLCFLKVRGQDSLYQQLAPLVADAMKKVDLIIDVRNTNEDSPMDTSFVNGDQRQKLRRHTDDFFTTYGISRLRVAIEKDTFESSIDSAVVACMKEIQALINT